MYTCLTYQLLFNIRYVLSIPRTVCNVMHTPYGGASFFLGTILYHIMWVCPRLMYYSLTITYVQAYTWKGVLYRDVLRE